MTLLHYDAPAREWLDCLPLGDGRLGAMLDGGIVVSRFRLNDGTAWSGSPESSQRDTIDAATARQLLADARAALARGDATAAEGAVQGLQARYSQAYLPFASLEVALPGAETPSAETPAKAYRRELDLLDGVHRVRSGSVRQTAFVSAVDGVLVLQIEAPAELLDAATHALHSPLRVLESVTQGERSTLLVRLPSDVAPGHEPDLPAAEWSLEPGAALEGAAVVGRRRAPGRLTLVVATATTFTTAGAPPQGDALTAARDAEARVTAALEYSDDELLTRHVRAHRPVMERLSIHLGPVSAAGDLPTDERVRVASESPAGVLEHDPGLLALAVQYGRYLQWSSARPGGLPPTLQGLWNDDLRPPWSSNYTLNINTPMNHWASFVSGLPETAEPFTDFILALAPHGERMARRLYDVPGWTAHHNSDAWCFVDPVGRGRADPRWANWPMAGPWLARHLWEAHEFSDDAAALERVWPTLRSAAEFGLHWLRRDEDGAWTTAPATSPENAFRVDDRATALDTVTAMDLALLRDLFDITDRAATRLGLDDDPVSIAARHRRDELPAAPAIAPDGTLVEWSHERVDDDPHHRHVSHLYALYPGAGRWSHEHRAAAAATLVARGDESSGWSVAWKLALWARLGRADKVADLLALALRPASDAHGPWAGGLYPNLFAAHPPFQIDGNLGLVAAVIEAIVQSHDGLELLPALPPTLAEGDVRGIVARPGIRVDVEWKGATLLSARLTPERHAAGEHRVRYRGVERTVTLREGETLVLREADFDHADPDHPQPPPRSAL